MDGDAQKEIIIAQKEANKLTAKVAGKLDIKNDDQLKAASEQLGAIKLLSKNIRAKKDAIIKPALLSIKNTRELFREPETKLFQAERDLKDAMTKYAEQKAAKAAKKAEKLEQQVQSGKKSLQDGAAELSKIESAPQTIHGEDSTTSFRTVKRIRINDITKIPVKYFMDAKVIAALESAVRKDALSGKPIPGVEVYTKKEVAVR